MAAPHYTFPGTAGTCRSTSRAVRRTRSRDRSSCARDRGIVVFCTSRAGQSGYWCWLGRTEHDDDHRRSRKSPQTLTSSLRKMLTALLRYPPLETLASFAGTIMRATAAYCSSSRTSPDVSLAVH
jgi:hypothetical protein